MTTLEKHLPPCAPSFPALDLPLLIVAPGQGSDQPPEAPW